MIQNLSSAMEAEQDLHIAKHVEPEKLPAMIQPIMNRANNNSCIACPQLSVLLTGTFSQYKALVPSIENGYFSRLLTLIVNDQQAFSSRYVEPANGSNGVMTIAAQQLFELCQALYKSRPMEFSLTSEQRARLGQHLETAYPALMQLLGVNFHSVVLRMAVHIERIAMV